MRVFLLVSLVFGYVACAQILGDTLRASSTASSRATTPKPTVRPTATTHRLPTTTRRGYINCYYCGGVGRPCPQPFYTSDRNVQIVPSYNGYCEKISPDNGGKGPFTRGAANPGECTRSGCSSKYISGQWREVCCCSRDYCNVGIVSVKSSWILVLGTFGLLSMFRQF
ncbi:unnamed protein product [Rotaria magnacalcarata]|uniref:Uncharacterized protein n=1 Tax=Rotaria magnacalcarata TaxID=392030 RepID=A0A815YTN9_9BILA|nr:unnamed protein product [Rotaria magnacalcarata]CAF1575048.1 unnamed protein product [Rotaria magnacalcarata]CAF2261452.1 unnamed protein product [Rotaria magnacalcarata]CAF3918228.1 unnamed protein product [Rotaria magnacalcarata]CAF3932426.1 unnamed protein product [Rotaria magnacalcarata]